MKLNACLMWSPWLKNQFISIIYTLSRLVSGWKSILNYWICWKEELLPCSSNVTLWRQWKWLCCEHFYEGVESYVSRKPTPKISAVGRLIDGFLMIIAGDENFSAKSSHSLAEAMPKESWYCDNNLYGAIVILWSHCQYQKIKTYETFFFCITWNLFNALLDYLFLDSTDSLTWK